MLDSFPAGDIYLQLHLSIPVLLACCKLYTPPHVANCSLELAAGMPNTLPGAAALLKSVARLAELRIWRLAPPPSARKTQFLNSVFRFSCVGRFVVG